MFIFCYDCLNSKFSVFADANLRSIIQYTENSSELIHFLKAQLSAKFQRLIRSCF